MARYPISASRNGYSGSNTTRRLEAMRQNEIAIILEDYINAMVAPSDRPRHDFTYTQLALALNLAQSDVQKILFGLDCGHTGFSGLKD